MEHYKMVRSFMKKRLTKIITFLTLILFLAPGIIVAQNDIEVIVHETTLTDTIDSEMIFDFEVVNISTAVQTVFEVRTINDLPPNWTSSLCFGENCFAPFVDSVATTPDFVTEPLNPGDTLITSLHVTAFINEGTANVQIQVGTLHNPDNRITIDFTATANPTAVENESGQPKEYFLEQNFPNPFNPSTKISYGILEAGVVNLKIYNILGSEVTTLVNEHKPAGNYEVSFGKGELASGVYIYRLTVNNFIQTRKMILEK
jgi:hypothetical protein